MVCHSNLVNASTRSYARHTDALLFSMCPPLPLLTTGSALVALPKFYTQVLHLMNKMNLPLPFEENVIPGVFSADRAERKRPRPVEPPSSSQFVEEEDEEDEEEEEVGDNTTDAVSSSSLSAITGSTARKRPRVGDDRAANDSSAAAIATQQRRAIAEPSQRLPLKRQLGKAPRVVGDNSQLSRAFQMANNNKQGHTVPRPGVITEAEVRRRRRLSSGTFLLIVQEQPGRMGPSKPASCSACRFLDMAAEPAMQNYSRGAPSSTIRVENLAEAVDEADLRSVFAFVLPPELDVMYVYTRFALLPVGLRTASSLLSP